MGSEREPGSPGRNNLLTICLLTIIVLMAAYAVFGNRGVMRIIQAQRQQQELQLRLQEMQQERQQLRQEIERLNSDRDYWEHLARTRLGMVREGEQIYYVPESRSAEKLQKEASGD
ncbi:MAG: septum formation initiator family protein [Pelovirga sp.]